MHDNALKMHYHYSKSNVAKSQLSFPIILSQEKSVFLCISATQQLQKVTIIYTRHKFVQCSQPFPPPCRAPLKAAVFFRSVCIAWFSGFVSILTPVLIPKAPSTAFPVFIPRDIGIRLKPDRADGTSVMGCC